MQENPRAIEVISLILSCFVRYYNGGAAAMDSKDGGVRFQNGGAVGNGYVSWVVGRLPASVAARINMAMMKGRTKSSAVDT